MYKILKNILFLFDPEVVHIWVMKMLNWVYEIPPARFLLKSAYMPRQKGLSKTLWGITFPNPVGLAAGFDKDATYIDALSCLGFGFIEIGTVTPLPQPGNPKPRLFRLPADKGLINRMGFNNYGAKNAAERISKHKERIIIGGNIGKNKDTPLENATADYERCFDDLYNVVDYFVVNVSSPNTPGLRALQDKEPLTQLLQRLQVLNKQKGSGKPILLKIAPDLTDAQLDEIVEIVGATQIQGIIATNTTIARTGLQEPESSLSRIGAGGLSGAPLKERSTEVIRYLHQKSNGDIPIIAVGGIFTAADAKEKLAAGAALVQVYTGFIYEGPAIAKRICKGL